MRVPIPIKGISQGFVSGDNPSDYTEYMNNMRPVDVNENKIRLGQRPGQDKWSTTQVSGSNTNPIVFMCSISTVND